MKKLLFISLILILGLVVFAQTQKSYKAEVSVYFSPNGRCQDAIIKEIRGAQKEILVQAYSFTSKDILDALITAKRKVKVEVIQDDQEHTKNKEILEKLSKANVSTYIDRYHYEITPQNYQYKSIAHDKIIIIDGKVVITGSFNFTSYAENYNGENLLIIKDAPELLKEYLDNYQKHKKHSKEYKYEK